MKVRSPIPFSLCFTALLALPVAAQTATQSPAASNSTDAITNELSQLSRSVETLNTRLKVIAEELLAPDAKQIDDEKVRQIATNLDMLTHTEERAEVLRKQLIELIEKETSYRMRSAQLDDDMRPENIERALSGYGTTRTVEMRDARRRSLESERRGIDSLLTLIAQSRLRLEEDVRQADSLVSKFRQRLFPLIEKQLQKLNPYQ
jgi:hypothetical protein